jgi:hypothetical protein
MSGDSMKVIIALFLVALSTTSFSKSYEISCKFSSISKDGKLFMMVDNLYKGNIDLNYTKYSDYEGEEAAFSYVGDELEWLWYLALSWDGQHIYKDNKNNLVYSMDSDGCDYGNLYLYANSNYTKGYLDIKHNCSGPERKKTYSKAFCKVTKK